MRKSPIIVITGLLGIALVVLVVSRNNNQFVKQSGLDAHTPAEIGVAGRQGTDSAPTEVALNAANVSPRNGLVKDADPITIQRLQIWLESTFLPRKKFLIRHRLVEINGDELGAAIRTSFEANSITNADGSPVESSEKPMIFDLFPDRSYQVVFDRISVSHYGHLSAHGTINRGDGRRSHVDIQIAPNREIRGTFTLHDGLFSVLPSPEYPVHVVTEIDSKAMGKNIVIH